MYCKNCGNKLNENEKFCSNCGMTIESNLNNSKLPNMNDNSNNSNISNMNTNSNINNYQQQINSVSGKANKWKTISMVLGIIAIVLSFIFYFYTLPLSIIGLIFGIKAKKEDTKNSIGFIVNIVAIAITIIMTIIVFVIDLPNNETNNYNNDNSYNDSNYGDYGETDGVKGNYSRDAFSGNSFEYKTGYDSATFIFNKDSTFEVSYVNGATYKGTYELYNGLYISVKADEIKNDTSINNNQQLSIDINNVANKMMSNTNDMLNTYLIWLKIDNNTIQPFMISYNPDSYSGTAVNILGQTQGTFNLK